jgi:hypothetical protein
VPILNEAYSYSFEEAPQYGVLRFLLEKEILKLGCIPDTHYSWMQTIYGFHGKNTIREDTRIEEEDYSGGISEGNTRINIVKHSRI